MIRLYGGTEYKPGLNLITGTTAAFDFENITQDDLNRAFADTNWTTGWTYTDDPLNNGGHAARQIGAWGFFQTTGLGDDRKDDVDRPFYWTTDVLATGNPDTFAIPGDYNGGHIGWFSGTAGKACKRERNSNVKISYKTGRCLDQQGSFQKNRNGSWQRNRRYG